MSQRFLLLAPFLIFLLLDVPLYGTGAPAITVTSPSNNYVSLVRTVNVTGSAAGTNASWLQTSQADFDSGARDNLSSGSTGNLTLNPTITTYDDFNDNSLDIAKWQYSSAAGVSGTEENGAMHLSGRSTTTSWGGTSHITSTGDVGVWLSADLLSFSGSGTAYSTGIALYQDGLNSVNIQQVYDPVMWGSPSIFLHFYYLTGGSYHENNIRNVVAGVHTYGLEYKNGTAKVYEDGSLLISQAILLSNVKADIGATARWTGDTVDARWDNVKRGTDFTGTGDYISAGYDTGADGMVLKKVQWTADLPAGTGAAVELRSSSTPDMGSPTQWSALTNGQSAGFPEVMRYLQYRLTLTSADGLNTPVFKEITIDYSIPVDRVDVSIDNKATWLPANGTAIWYIDLELPDGPTHVWARATDLLGDTTLISIKVDVDTTRPVGTVAINDDDPFTIDRQVTVAIDASDRYGVAWLMVGERPDLGDAEWKEYSPTAVFLLSAGDGKKTVYARFKDANGWESNTVNDSIMLDTLPPVGSVAIEGGAAVTRNVTVTLALNATDQLGVSKMQVSNLADLSDASWTDYHGNLSWSLVEGNGARNVFARFRDAGGHESKVYNASIFLDTTAPSLIMKVNNGAFYTTATNVTLDIQAVEDYRVDSMQVAEGANPFFSSMAWAPWRPSMTFQLSPAEGTKTVTARLLDAAGNIGQMNSTSIILDYTPPVTKMTEPPSVMPRAKFTISWNATDTASGVLWYDVQYSADNGTWKDWQTHTNATSAQFTGEDLSSYSFRARAQDRAGNLEPFPAAADRTVLVQLPEPVVTIMEPAANAVVRGKAVTVRGTCRLVPEGRTVDQVSVRIDTGEWEVANGTLNWSYQLDTTRLKNGPHALAVRTYDGERYSAEVSSQFTVRNPAPVTTTNQMPMYLAAVVVMAIVGGIAALMFARRRKPPAQSRAPVDAQPQPYQYAPVQQRPPPPSAP